MGLGGDWGVTKICKRYLYCKEKRLINANINENMENEVVC